MIVFVVSCVCISMWVLLLRHVGATKTSQPTYRGFSEALSFSLISRYLEVGDPEAMNCELGDMLDKFLWASVRYEVRKDRSNYFKPRGYLTDYLADEAVKAIEANRNNPFFMYLAFTAVHSPLQALKSDYDSLSGHTDMSHCEKVYGAMLIALDRAVGKVLDSLKRLGLADNTMVIFTSDNGGPSYVKHRDINAPYRGWKATFFEGGMKVPFLMTWPSVLPTGVAFMPVVSHVDIFPTIMQLAKPSSGPMAEASVDSVDVDGVDLMSAVLLHSAPVPANVNTNSPAYAASLLHTSSSSSSGDPAPTLELLHKQLYWRSSHYEVMRRGKWKLQVSHHRPAKLWLYDLVKDPAEETNLAYAPAFNAILKEMRGFMAEERKLHREPLWPSLSESPVMIDKLWSDDYEEGDEYIYWAN
jgi:arylsulfatase A-like enzyme